MDAAQLRQTIQQQLEQLSSDRLRTVADFISFLNQREANEKAEQQPNASNFRPPTQSLLNQTQTWVGDDFEDCLETVYQSRSPLQG